MTFPELADRANAIWGHKRVIACHGREDKGIDVNCLRGQTPSDVRGRTFSSHRLNEAGDPICHLDCQALAKEHGV